MIMKPIDIGGNILKVIRVDIDETICNTPDSRDYTKSTPILDNIQKINKLYDMGHHIIYWTARGSRSGINWQDYTEWQLKSWGVKFHKVECNKPYFDILIDDRSIRIEEI